MKTVPFKSRPSYHGSSRLNGCSFIDAGGAAAVQFQFTDVSLGGGGSFCSLSAPINMGMKDCSLLAAKVSVIGGYGADGVLLGFTNNIFERCGFSLLGCYGNNYSANFCNNLFQKGSVGLALACGGSILTNFAVWNNLFVGSSFTYGYTPGYEPVIANNGYYQATLTSYGNAPKTITTLDFQNGPLGPYYYPLTGTGGGLSQLFDVGSGSPADVGLESFTTRTNQYPDTGAVDIGFHYHTYVGQIMWTWTNDPCSHTISSSPAIGTNGIIYLTDKCNLYAIDPATHNLWSAWNNNGFGGFYPLTNNAIGELVSSPMIGKDGTTIYVGASDLFYDATLYAVKANNGIGKWTFSAGESSYFSTAALASDGTIYVGNEFLTNYYAVTDNTTFGGLKQSFNGGLPKQLGSDSAAIDASAAIGIDGSTSYIATEEGDILDTRIYAVNAAGTKLWDYPLQQPQSEFHRSPSVGSDGTVYVGDFGGTLYAFYPDSQTTQTKWIYQTPSGDAITTTPIIGPDGTIYFGSHNNVLYAVNSTDGTPKWSYTFNSGSGDILAAPALAADGTLYVSSTDGNLYAMPTGASAPSGPLWQAQVPVSAPVEDLTSSPAIATNGMVYIGGWDGLNHGILYAIQGAAGPAISPWPMWRKNNAHQANAALP